MAAACALGATIFATEYGDAWGIGDVGPAEDPVDGAPPVLKGGEDSVFGADVLMVSAGRRHACCVTSAGSVWAWGHDSAGCVGNGAGARDCDARPVRHGRELFHGARAVMVSCGYAHTLVLTDAASVWACGDGMCGQLGQQDVENRALLTLVRRISGLGICMVSAGRGVLAHSVAVSRCGTAFVWGCALRGRLGAGAQTLVGEVRQLPSPGGERVVLAAAGAVHTVAVTTQGHLWAWGEGRDGQLGLGDQDIRTTPTRVSETHATPGVPDAPGACGTHPPPAPWRGAQVLLAACGDLHTLVVTNDGAVWTFGCGHRGQLGHGDFADRDRPTRIEGAHFGSLPMATVAGGTHNSAAVSASGALYTWGDRQPVPRAAPRVAGGARVGRFHGLSAERGVAFCAGVHARLGRPAPHPAPAATELDASFAALRLTSRPSSPEAGPGCVFYALPTVVVGMIAELCESVDWHALGLQEGVLRLLGVSARDRGTCASANDIDALRTRRLDQEQRVLRRGLARQARAAENALNAAGVDSAAHPRT